MFGAISPAAVLDFRGKEVIEGWIEVLEPRVLFAVTPAPVTVHTPAPTAQFGPTSVAIVAAPTNGASASPSGGNAFNGYSVGPDNVAATPATAALLGINAFNSSGAGATSNYSLGITGLTSPAASPASFVGSATAFGSTPISASSIVDSITSPAASGFTTSVDSLSLSTEGSGFAAGFGNRLFTPSDSVASDVFGS